MERSDVISFYVLGCVGGDVTLAIGLRTKILCFSQSVEKQLQKEGRRWLEMFLCLRDSQPRSPCLFQEEKDVYKSSFLISHGSSQLAS